MSVTNALENGDRLQRHLSRQRGAGARSLATSFGFSFGQWPATPTLEEGLPASGRQLVVGEQARVRQCTYTGTLEGTRLPMEAEQKNRIEEEDIQNEPCSPAPAESRNIAKPASRAEDKPREEVAHTRATVSIPSSGSIKGIESKAGTKGRRKRKLEDIAEEKNTEHKEPAEDSFVKGLKSVKKPRCAVPKNKKKKKKKAVEVEQVDESVAPEEPTSRRPRRQAAVAARQKVADTFVEEAMPIDQKRRDPEPIKPSKRGRKKTTGQQPVPEPGTEPIEHTLSTENIVSADQPTGNSATTMDQHKENVPGMFGPKTKRAPRRVEGIHSPKPQRIPLAETHPNAMTRSVSPDKKGKKSKQAAVVAKKTVSSMRLNMEVLINTQQRSITVREDPIEDDEDDPLSSDANVRATIAASALELMERATASSKGKAVKIKGATASGTKKQRSRSKVS